MILTRKSDEAIPRGRRNVILRGEFERLAPIGVTKNQLSPEMFISPMTVLLLKRLLVIIFSIARLGYENV